MGHFAKLDDNLTVTQVIVVNNETLRHLPYPESEIVGVAFCQSLFGVDTIWKQTSYNGNFRKNFAGFDYTYDTALDAFIPPKPFASWILNTETCRWEPPVSYPNDGKPYIWNEDVMNWVEIINQ
jgi:hypothetical protein